MAYLHVLQLPPEQDEQPDGPVLATLLVIPPRLTQPHTLLTFWLFLQTGHTGTEVSDMDLLTVYVSLQSEHSKS
jgi:hypothetical protein